MITTPGVLACNLLVPLLCALPVFEGGVVFLLPTCLAGEALFAQLQSTASVAPPRLAGEASYFATLTRSVPADA